MTDKNSVLKRGTRYVSGGTTEVNSTSLEWWERDILPEADDDIAYVVEKKFVGRIDLIAAVYLNDPKLWWLIAQYNNILDPYSEIVEGLILYIPTKTRADGMLQGRLGGISSTREVPISILPIV